MTTAQENIKNFLHDRQPPLNAYLRKLPAGDAS